jgi:hypothetical protein
MATYTPDTMSLRQLIAIGTVGANILAAPTMPAQVFACRPGRAMMLDIVNQSGGAITLTFDVIYKVVGYTDPANGKRKTALFNYETSSEQWIQTGAWSPDL